MIIVFSLIFMFITIAGAVLAWCFAVQSWRSAQDARFAVARMQPRRSRHSDHH